MNFLAPAAFAFLATIPVVVVFYLLKRKRVVRLVPSTVLWQRFLAESQASAPFQKLRHNWLLILQILLLLLAVLALSRPYFADEAAPSSLRIMILDASASMQSSDVEPSRFEEARKQALEWVNGLREGERMIVMKAGAVTEVLQSATSDRSSLRRAIQNCRVTDSPTRLLEALKMAGNLIQNEPEPRIHLFSDGALSNLEELQNHDLPIEFHSIGNSRRNAGITTLDVRSNPENPNERAIYVGVSNRSLEPIETQLELRFQDRLVDTRPLSLEATNTAAEVFLVSQTEDGVFQLNIDVDDDLAVDNQASVVSLLPQTVKILLVTQGNRFLEKALRVAGNVELSVTSEFTQQQPDMDIVVLDNVNPQVWPENNLMAIHTVNTNWFPSWNTVESPAVVDWKTTDALLRFTSFDNILIGEALDVEPPPWARVVVEASGETPLILAGEPGRQRAVWIAFDTLRSTWPQRISFPIFMANALEWLNPASSLASLLNVQAGSPLRWRLDHTVTNAAVIYPGGYRQEVRVRPEDREIVFGNTAQSGVYQLQLDNRELPFVANLLDAGETDITPRQTLPMGSYGQVEGTETRRATTEMWRWLAALGLAVLLFEWWFYHRRTA